MQTTNNTTNNAAQTLAAIINALLIVAGLTVIAYMFYLQLTGRHFSNPFAVTMGMAVAAIVKPAKAAKGKAGKAAKGAKAATVAPAKHVPTKTNPVIPTGVKRQTMVIAAIVKALVAGTPIYTTFGVHLSAKAMAKRKNQQGTRVVLVGKKQA